MIYLHDHIFVSSASSVDFFGVIYEGSYSITYDETPGNFLQYTLVNNPEWDM